MPRKSVIDLKSSDNLLDQATEEFKDVSEVKAEMARAVYDQQDAKTKAVIDSIHATLQHYATGYITVQLAPPSGALTPVKLDNEYLGYNLLYLAVEIVKDLAITGIRVASFVFPPSLCVECGAEVIPEKRSRKKAARG